MQTNHPPLNLDVPDLDDDDMLPEYDFSHRVRNHQPRAEALRKSGYSVTVHHPDGTSTTHYISPAEMLDPNRQNNPSTLLTPPSHE